MKLKIASIATSLLIHCYFAAGILIAFVDKNNKKRSKKSVPNNAPIKEHEPSLR